MENYNSPPPPYDETQSITNKGNSTTPSATFIPMPQSYGTLPDPNNGNLSNQPEPYMFQPHLPNIPNQNQSNYISQLPPSPPLGRFPAEMYCQYCQNRIITVTTNTTGPLPWIIFIVCFLSGFVLFVPWLLCWIPFCIQSCLDVVHTCPNCKCNLGQYSILK